MKVLKLVEKWAKELQVSCEESCYQCDWIMERQSDFMVDMIRAANAFCGYSEEDVVDNLIEIGDNSPSSNGHYLGLDREP